MNIGSSELLLILIVVLLVFGPSKLPELGRTIGRAVGEFRRTARDFEQTWELEAANAAHSDRQSATRDQEAPGEGRSEGQSESVSQNAAPIEVKSY